MSNKKILVVEDNHVVAMYIKEMIKSRGYEVFETAASGEEAIALVSKEQPDLILMDIILDGELDGIETAKKINEMHDIPIIYISANTDEGCLRRAADTIPYGYISKPIEEFELYTNINSALVKHELESKLKFTEEKYNALFKRQLDAVYISDFEGCIIDANDAAIKLLGYGKEEIGKINYGTLIAEEHVEKAAAVVEELMATGTQQKPAEYKLITKDGSFVWIESMASIIYSRGEPYAIQGIARDITERKEMEQELVESRGRLVDLVESIDSMFIGITLEGNITLWNRRSEEILELPQEQVLDKRIDQTGIDWDWDIVNDSISLCKRTNKPVFMEDVVLKSGSDNKILGMKITPVFSRDKTLNCFLLWGTDITEKRSMEAKIIQMQKLESIGQLAAGIAHEINNPVGYLLSNYRYLERYIKDIKKITGDVTLKKKLEELIQLKKDLKIEERSGEIDGILEDNLKGLEKIRNIVSRLKDFARPNHNETFKKANINSAIEDALTIVHNEIKHKCEITLELGEIPSVYCNIGEINQVFVNIIINAAQAIESQKRDKRGSIKIRTYEETDSVCCEISDDGPGISKDIRKKIFDPFFTTREVGKSTGLGLNISYDIIVNRHRGTIGVESKKGAGTVFIVKTSKNLKPGKEE